MFLSDGAPSDHCERYCEHGVQVWQNNTDGQVSHYGKVPLQICEDSETAKLCRREICDSVHDDCVKRISRLRDLFGRDRTFIGTVAFGPASEDYRVLRDMAKKLPRNSFQKLGLNAGSLKTALSSLTSDLTTLNTQMMSGGLTVRNVKQQEAGTQFRDLTWDIYKTTDKRWTLKQKARWDIEKKSLVTVPFAEGVSGVATAKEYKAKGAERYVHQCVELNSENQAIGLQRVAKWPVHEEYMNLKFPRRFCKMQAKAENLAKAFNARLRPYRPEWQVHFIQCVVYFVVDERYDGDTYILCEDELEGVFTKWNNNGGSKRDVVPSREKRAGAGAGAGAGLGAIMEGSEDESDETDDESDGDEDSFLNQVPQCFSHFTHAHTNGRNLVCDIQGVWNKFDGFTLTDPVFHDSTEKHKYGPTDKGEEGIRKFFETHTCGGLCRVLGLQKPDY